MTAEYLIFYIVILLANIIQGITGFAGTILAMPVSMMTVGFDVARPVLNGLGIIAGFMVLVKCYKKINWKEFSKIVIVMAAGIVAGMVIKHCLYGKESILFKILGVFIICIALPGLFRVFWPRKKTETKVEKKSIIILKKIEENALLISAGIIHGIFVSGGPLLISYLTQKIKDKDEFRATISTVWILLNGIIFITDCVNKTYTKQLWETQLIAVPFMVAGVITGSILYKHMSQKAFVILTYILLIISGISLLFK